MNGYALFSPSRASPQPPTALLRGRALQCKVQWFKALWLPRVIPFWQQAILTERAEHPSGSTKPNPFLGEPSGRVPAAQLFLCTGVGQESPFPGITTLLLQVPYSQPGLQGRVRGASATLAGSPLIQSIRWQAEWKGTLGVNSPCAPVTGMLGATRGPLCGTGPRPSAPGLSLPHPGTALSPLLFPSIIRRSGGCARMCPVSTSGCKELNSYQLLERRKRELLFTEKSDVSPPAAPFPLPASNA